MRASLLFTFSLQTTTRDDCRGGSGDDDDAEDGMAQNVNDTKKVDTVSGGPGGARRRLSGPKKYDGIETLSLGHKLIGSIIRCDWDHLDARVREVERKATMARSSPERRAKAADAAIDNGEGGMDSSSTQNRKRRHPHPGKPFFPDSLNVEELYDRISGASKYLGDENDGRADGESSESRPPSPSSSSRPENLVDLPDDIIATSIAPYLRARSLHSLRVVNRKLHRSLRAVVPGLRLKLFHHQIRSLEWMEMRERRCVTEEDIVLRGGSCRVDGVHPPRRDEGEIACGGDYHRAVTGGATVLLRPRPDSGHSGDAWGGRPLRFDSETGRLVSLDCGAKKNTRCARGGLLCDDPGLGKTITVVSLILRTFGLSNEARVDTVQAVDDCELFYSYWNSSFLTAYDRRREILRLITRLVNSDRESSWFVSPINPDFDEVPDYLDVISTPISLQDIRNKYKNDCKDFKAFEADVELCFSNGMTYNPPHHDVYKAAERLSKNFSELTNEVKRQNIENATKSISRRYGMAKDPNTRSLVNSFEAKKRAEFEESLLPSSSTLLVVPNPLIHHWKEQLLLHIDFGYISKNGSRSPLIYYHTSKRNIINSDKKISFNLRSISDPVIFIDDGSKELPPPSVLARFRVVLTSYNRFTAEWKHGNVEQEIRASKKSSGGGCNYWGDGAPEASSLLKVSWLRVIIDEGHVLGKSANNLFQFASWLSAERLWAMTGTPTQQIATQNGLTNLFCISNFLKHEFFSQRLGRKHAWNALLSTGWRGGDFSSFFRLKHLVSYLMVRHTKADLVEIPPPVYSYVDLDLSQSETATYNTIVSGIRMNIITTSMSGKTSGWQDSLLNPRQSRYALEALTNLRVACCGGAQILPQIKNIHWGETLEMCRRIHNLDDVQVQIVNNFIYRAQAGELSGCHSCGVQLQVLFVIPCGHLICSECINNETTSCPVCQKPFDVDDFQRLQPGLDNQFCLNLQEEKKEREKQLALKRAFADSSQPGRRSDVDVLEEFEVNAPTANHARSHRRGESCVYSSLLSDGKCTICREEHYDCNFIKDGKQCSICFKYAEECPDYNRKSKYVIEQLLQLRDFINDGTGRFSFSPTAARLFAISGKVQSAHRQLKAIVFSQFRTIYEYFGDHLIRRFGGACVADYSFGGTRNQELQKFIHSPECFVMLLSKQGAVGLDLSFVTHIFFLDSIFDKSLKSQVVARAYRMGALGPVFVEQLTAKSTIEEVMNEMNEAKQTGQTALDAISDPKEKHAKLHKLLKSAKLIRPPQESKVKKRKIMESSDDAAGAKTGRIRFQD